MHAAKILAIDSATDACSVALLTENKITEIFQIAPQQHGNLLLTMIQELLTQADLSLTALQAFAFSCGPGSFTGIRIATGIIQGLALGGNLPVIPLSTLQIMAQGIFREKNVTRVLPSLDARMNEIYWGAYEVDTNQIMQPIVSDSLSKPTEILVPPGTGWFGCGNAWKSYGEILQKKCEGKLVSVAADRYPQAKDALYIALERYKQGNTVAADQVTPTYLRGEAHWKKM